MKKTTIPLIIFLIVALVGGLMLVKQNQETRKGATFGKTILKLLPSEKINGKVGETFPVVHLWFQTESEAKVDGVQAVVCYGDELSLDKDTGVVGNTAGGFISDPVVVDISGVGTTRMCATIAVASNKAADKLLAVGEAFKINFTAVKNGGGSISINKSKSMVTGDNPKDPIDKQIEITSVENTTYWIGDGNEPTVTPGGPTITPGEPTATPGACIQVGQCKVAGKGCCSGNTVVDDTCTGTLKRCAAKPTVTPGEPTATPTCKSVWIIDNNACVQKEFCGEIPVDFVYYNTKEACEDALNWCDDTHPCPQGYNCAMPEPVGDSEPQGMVALRGVCIPINTPVLNYKVTFGGVIASEYTKCAVDWPLKIMVRSAGESKVYTDVPVAISTTGKLIQYQGSLPLVGFNHLTNITALIKGPKHIQTKYAIQNQSSRYDQYIGKLVLTTSKETSQLYNFTDYPMLAGDVVGATVDNGPDGEVNGVDYAYIKSKASVFEEKDLRGDLDGNCQVNSNDVFLLKVTLETKQGELY